MLPNSRSSKRKWLQLPDNLMPKISKTSRDASPSGSRTPVGTSTPGAGSTLHAYGTCPSSQAAPPAPGPQEQSPPQPQSQASASSTTGAMPKLKSSAVRAMEAALRNLHISTKIVPPLHAAVDTLTSCLDVFEVWF